MLRAHAMARPYSDDLRQKLLEAYDQGQGSLAEVADPVRVFVARSSDLDFNCGQILREALIHLGLRGGGSADLAQGEVPAEHETALRASVRDAICIAVG